jgi:hypothetical protein
VEHNLHETDDRLEQYALDRLPEADLPRVEEHLMACTACRERLDEIGDFALGMRDVTARQTESFRWLRRPAFSMAVAFAALIVVVGIVSNGRTKFAPAVSLQLTAVRGEMPSTVPAREFDLTLADGPREGGPFRIEVVNAMGSAMWSGLAESDAAGVHVMVMQRMTTGDYFVRVYSGSGKMLREYGFRVRN